MRNQPDLEHPPASATGNLAAGVLRPRGACRSASIATLLIVALLIRVWAAARYPNIIWHDEVYQTVEPGRHLVYGAWIRSWEWVVGMRSWLVPSLLVPPLWLGRMIDPAGPTGAHLVTMLMIALSLTPIVVGYLWGERMRGPLGGLFVGSVAALWPDLIYMAPHPLIDVFASHLLLVALYAAFPLVDRPSLRRLTIAGALLGVTVYLRMQLGPAAALAMLLAAGRSTDRWRAVLCGSGIVLAAVGVFDWITLGTPFQSIWLNFWFNIVGKVSDEFGVESPLFYLGAFPVVWGPAFLVAFTIVLLNVRKHAELFLVFLAIVATQSVVGHKEWRFVFPAISILTLLIALGLLDAIPRLSAFADRWGAPRWTVAIATIALTGGLCLAIPATPVFSSLWNNRSGMLRAFERLRQSPDICGIGVLYMPQPTADLSWVFSPGSAALAADTPLYAALPKDGWKSSASYNAAVIEDGHSLPPPFRLVSCAAPGTGNPLIPGARTCLWRRPGGCNRAAAEPLRVNWPRYFLDDRGRVRADRVAPVMLGFRPKPAEPLATALSLR